MNVCTIAALAAASALAASAASASVLYDNGPINGTITGWNIGYDAVFDSFTLSSPATVTGVTFGVWTYPGDSIATVDWAIASTAGNDLDTATATVTDGPTTPDGFFNLSVDSFSTGPVSLAGGTYYLVLQDASVGNGDSVFWDDDNGPSTAKLGSLEGEAIGSESFQILGSPVPEAASWALMLIGSGALGARLRSRRSALAKA